MLHSVFVIIFVSNFISIHSIKHIRYMRYKSKKVHVIDSFIGNKVYKLYFSFSFCMNIILYIHMLGNIGVVCMTIRYYWPACVYTWQFDVLYRHRYENKWQYFIGWHMKYEWRYANYSQGTQIQGIEIWPCINIYTVIYTA